MSQQINKDIDDREGSGLETQDSTLTSKNISQETTPEPSGEAEAVDKKSFSERWKTNRFWLIRGSYYVLYSVWMTVMFIGGIIVWLISLLFI